MIACCLGGRWAKVRVGVTAGPEIIRGDFLEEVYYALRMQGDGTDWL